MENLIAVLFNLYSVLPNFYFWNGTGHYIMPTLSFEITCYHFEITLEKTCDSVVKGNYTKT